MVTFLLQVKRPDQATAVWFKVIRPEHIDNKEKSVPNATTCPDPSTIRTVVLAPSAQKDYRVKLDLKRVHVLAPAHVAQLLEFMSSWPDRFGPGNTYADTTCGVPSLFVRFDFVIGPNDEVLVYEIDDRPGGLGLTGMMNPGFAQIFERVRSTWPEFKLVVSSGHGGFDDHLWLDRISLEEALATGQLVLVRSRPGETEYHLLEPQAVSTISREGAKHYGISYGWWHIMHELEDWVWDQPGVFKPLQSCGSYGLRIFHPDRLPGTVAKRGHIRGPFKKAGQMYYQRFHHPMPSGDAERPFRILRVYFLWDITTHQWVCAGGVTCDGEGAIVHGQDNSVYGLVTLG